MVTKKDLDESIATLTNNFQKMLDDSIGELKNTIIDNLKKSNENLQLRVSQLEKEVETLQAANINLERNTEAALQHGRLEQIIISGIPARVDHGNLEGVCVEILNGIKDHDITPDDIAACHRLGKKEDTILRFVNRKDAEDCLENRSKLKNLNKEAVGLDAESKIFVRENLSPFMNKLAYYCRVLKRKNLIDKITTYKGVVKIFMTIDNVRAVRVIGHKKDLENIFTNLDDLLKE